MYVDQGRAAKRPPVPTPPPQVEEKTVAKSFEDDAFFDPLPPMTDTILEKRSSKKGRKITVSLVAVLVVIGAGAATYFYLGAAKKGFPKAVSSQASYAVFSPKDATQVRVDNKTAQYDPSTKLLTFTTYTVEGTKLIFSEQATPESLTDVPQAYDKLTASLQTYETFDSVNGRVNLTHPKELKGEQAAVMNSKGTLLFARAKQDISNEKWRQIFNQLEVDK